LQGSLVSQLNSYIDIQGKLNRKNEEERKIEKRYSTRNIRKKKVARGGSTITASGWMLAAMKNLEYALEECSLAFFGKL
jgi:hypothetical protein